jgi:Purple acid Phosphatase, N-terminal domain
MQQGLIRSTLMLSAIICGLLLLGHHTLILAADVSLSWRPNSEPELAGYKVYYGGAPGSYGISITVGMQTTHTVTGLNAGTYYFAVTAYDNSGNETGFSNEVSKTITSSVDTRPPVVSSIQSTNITSSGATITWSTNEASDTQVEYGTSTAYGNSTPLNASLVTAHSVSLSGLQANTSYNYRVKSRDAAGNLAVSGNLTFVTPQQPVLNFTQISLSEVSNTSARINWSTDKATTGLIEYGTNSVGELSKLETTLATQHRTDLVGLSPSTVYSYRVTATDADSNQAVTDVLSFKTSEEPVESATPSSEATFISQVIESSDFRTNLGVNNLSSSMANVSVTLVDVDGMKLATKTLQVEPQGLAQLNAVASYLNEENLGNEIRGSLHLESDHPISAWASQIENSTSDPSLLLSQRSGATQLLIPSAANTGAFTSSLVLMNVGENTSGVAIKVYSVDGAVLGQTTTPLSIPANGLLSFDNILETLGVSDNYGPLEITSLDNMPLVAASRVSSASKAGGFFEGIDYAEASLLQFIPHVVDTVELRTNIGINNVSDQVASVMVRLMSPQGTELGALPVMVMPRGMTQLNQVVRQLLNRGEVSNVEGYIRLESSQPILGWASQIDNATDDPGFAVSKGVGASKLLVQSTANVGNFKSSLVVVNPGEAAAAVDIVAHNVQGTVQGELRGQVIPPGGFVSVANILERLGGFNSYGPVEILSTNGQPLLATSRVYSLNRTSGFFAARVRE